ncbi:hypothetical protein SAMN02745857_02310 [Andreprevotia lacus DSM 23236]|jgi:hypothetical protein|uniref:NAD dependent epimerase/dehydratase family protein n=1 Tax=Andreprevotia lacus DSM 23236 TaxID=1121001 RepID=A0A1W1XPT0_9NEIS|nr:hypothetical protein [Andreprevotia lacus]SMC25884.1 hypothetical protein SAMN02745857_02310 [Andreprevotia lacus DSM 23236]
MSNAPHIDLRGALYEAPTTGDQRRTALIAGAVNRLGEALLNRLLVEYRQVWVLTSKPMVSSTARCDDVLLRAEPLDHAELAAAVLPQVDDVYCHVGPRGLSNQRDAGLHAVAEHDILPLAQAAARAGSKRFCLVQPIAASVQMLTHLPLAGSELGRQLALLPFEHVSHIYPSVYHSGPAPKGWLNRFKAAYLSQFAYMLPKSVSPLTSERVAQATTLLMQQAQPGHASVDIRGLRAALGLA